MPEITTRDRVMGSPLAALAALIDARSHLAVEVEPELGNTEDGQELRRDEKHSDQHVPGDLPHGGSVDGS